MAVAGCLGRHPPHGVADDHEEPGLEGLDFSPVVLRRVTRHAAAVGAVEANAGALRDPNEALVEGAEVQDGGLVVEKPAVRVYVVLHALIITTGRRARGEGGYHLDSLAMPLREWPMVMVEAIAADNLVHLGRLGRSGADEADMCQYRLIFLMVQVS